MRKTFLLSCAVLFSVFAFLSAHADKYFEETLPMEVALIYYKLIDSAPNFEEMATYSPSYQKAPELGKEMVLEEQKNLIERIYYNINGRQEISIVDNFEIRVIKESVAPENDDTNQEEEGVKNPLAHFSYTLPEMKKDLHYVYDFADNAYIVFIRNADEFNMIRNLPVAPQKTLLSIIEDRVKVGVEMELIPFTADVKPYMKDGEPMRLVLADMAMLRLIDNESGDVIWEMTPLRPPGESKTKMDLFFEEALQKLEAENW